MEFLNKDTSIKTDYYLSDVRITGEGALFCFDYCVSGMPVVIGGNIRNEYGINHAMEVLVSGNSVRKFKKYNSILPKILILPRTFQLISLRLLITQWF